MCNVYVANSGMRPTLWKCQFQSNINCWFMTTVTSRECVSRLHLEFSCDEKPITHQGRFCHWVWVWVWKCCLCWAEQPPVVSIDSSQCYLSGTYKPWPNTYLNSPRQPSRELMIAFMGTKIFFWLLLYIKYYIYIFCINQASDLSSSPQIWLSQQFFGTVEQYLNSRWMCLPD